MIGSGIVWIITAVAAMGEREAWTTRVRRTHPPQSALAGRRFLLYTGSAGGLIWSALMFAATIVAAIVFAFRSAWSPRQAAGIRVMMSIRSEVAANLSIVFGYVLCYCLTTAFLRLNVLAGCPRRPCR